MKTAAVIVLLMMAVLVDGQQKTEPALDRLAVEFGAAFNAKDASKLAAFYTADAVLMPPDEQMVKGRANIELYYARGFVDQDVSNFSLTPMESAAAGGLAFEAGTSRLTHGRGSSVLRSAGVTENGKYLVVYKRVGSEWKIAYDIFNAD